MPTHRMKPRNIHTRGLVHLSEELTIVTRNMDESPKEGAERQKPEAQ